MCSHSNNYTSYVTCKTKSMYLWKHERVGFNNICWQVIPIINCSREKLCLYELVLTDGGMIL